MWKKKQQIPCVDCKRPFFALASQRLRCDACAVINRRNRQNQHNAQVREERIKRRAEQRREKIASGKCETCNDPPREGKTTCLECAKKINTRWMSRYRIRREQARQREREAAAAFQAAQEKAEALRVQRREEAEEQRRKEDFDERWRRLWW